MDIIGDQRTTEDFMRAAVERGIRRWDIHTCGGCGYACGFIIDGEAVLYDSGCDCGGRGPLQSRSWSDLADHYNRNQPSRNPQADGKPFLTEMRSFWGFNGDRGSTERSHHDLHECDHDGCPWCRMTWREHFEAAEAVAGPGHVANVPVSASEPNPPKAGRGSKGHD